MDASLPPIELPSPAYTENRDALYALIGEAFKLKAGQSTTGILRMPSKEDYGNHFVFGLRVHKAFPQLNPLFSTVIDLYELEPAFGHKSWES